MILLKGFLSESFLVFIHNTILVFQCVFDFILLLRIVIQLLWNKKFIHIIVYVMNELTYCHTNNYTLIIKL